MPDWLNGVRLHASRVDGGAGRSRIAKVTAFDPSTHAVRLTIEPEGVQTGWTPLLAVSVGAGVGMVAPPAVGDQVLVQPQEGSGNHWMVVGRFFTTQAAPPVSPATDKPLDSGEVGIFAEGAFIHVVGGVVHVRASEIRSEGHWKHKGQLEVTEGDVKADGVSLKSHRNTGVRGGTELSGPPQQ